MSEQGDEQWASIAYSSKGMNSNSVAGPTAMNRSIRRRKYTERLQCDLIQNPMDGPFSSDHLKWYHDTAWISESRLEDFLEGEEHRPLCNTQFKTRTTEETHCKITRARLRSIKRYWCTYGPKDLRGMEEKDLPDARTFANGKVPLRHTTLTGYSVRRGCRCHFHVTRFEERKLAVKITWINRQHADSQGRACHGLLDTSAEFVNAHVAPRLSKRTSIFIERLIRSGVSTSKIMQAHWQNLRTHWRSFYPNDKEPAQRWSRDMMLGPKDLKAIRQSVLRKGVDYTIADHLAVHTWVANNKEKVFLYRPKDTEDTPFLLAWATEWQIEKAAILGHGKSVAMDATFGTNVWDLALFTILAYDDHQNGLPVAWALMEKHKSEHLILFLNALKDRVEQYRADNLLQREWTPISFMIDVACEEILSLRTVWPRVPINLCLWHVRRAWTKNLLTKVKNAFNRADISRDLKGLMYNSSEDPTAASLTFMNTWESSEPSFIAYYGAFWHPKLERWMKQLRKYDHQNQNTNGAIERWHHTMKMHLRTEKATKCGRSVKWLLGMLTEDLEQFYWCMLCLKNQGAIRNQVKEGYVWTAIHKARLIRDDQVRYVDTGPHGQTRAQVTTFRDGEPPRVHIVENYNRDNCTCTCGHSEQGNTCKHQLKVLLLDGYTEMKLFNLLGTKWGSCCGGLEYEYAVIAEETVDGESLPSDLSPPTEVNITFPLRSFATIAEEEAVEDVPEYHEYNLEYYTGLAAKGYKKLQNQSAGLRNQALVKLRAWLEWVCNQEAMADPPDLEQFPLTQFMRPVGAENTLKRKKDCVERYWDKRTKGKSSQKATCTNIVGAELQCDSFDDPESDYEKEMDDVQTSNYESLEGWERVCSAQKIVTPIPGFAAEGMSTFSAGDTGHNSTCGQKPRQVLPFAKKNKQKESDQEMLDRVARESLNLNVRPMDIEPVTPPSSPCKAAGNSKGVQKARLKKPVVAQSALVRPILTKQSNGAQNDAPKRRGRPPGSKNRVKAPGKENVIHEAIDMVLLEESLVAQWNSVDGQPLGLLTNFLGVPYAPASTDLIIGLE